jgi:heme-degrading monooxygenase HmoA
MIARIWRGVVRLDDADEYAGYIRDTGFTEYAATSGNRGAWMLRHDTGDRTEFLTLSLWDSLDAIRAFAGDDIEAAVLYPEDVRYLAAGQAGFQAAVDAVLAAPGVDRLAADAQRLGDLGDRPASLDQVQDLAAELGWVPASSHAALLLVGQHGIQQRDSTEVGEDQASGEPGAVHY